jgi:hypothetical protein
MIFFRELKWRGLRLPSMAFWLIGHNLAQISVTVPQPANPIPVGESQLDPRTRPRNRVGIASMYGE